MKFSGQFKPLHSRTQPWHSPGPRYINRTAPSRLPTCKCIWILNPQEAPFCSIRNLVWHEDLKVLVELGYGARSVSLGFEDGDLPLPRTGVGLVLLNDGVQHLQGIVPSWVLRNVLLIPKCKWHDLLLHHLHFHCYQALDPEAAGSKLFWQNITLDTDNVASNNI